MIIKLQQKIDNRWRVWCGKKRDYVQQCPRRICSDCTLVTPRIIYGIATIEKYRTDLRDIPF